MVGFFAFKTVGFTGKKLKIKPKCPSENCLIFIIFTLGDRDFRLF